MINAISLIIIFKQKLPQPAPQHLLLIHHDQSGETEQAVQSRGATLLLTNRQQQSTEAWDPRGVSSEQHKKAAQGRWSLICAHSA